MNQNNSSMMLKTYKYRLRPNKVQEKQLLVVLDSSRKLYNTGLEELITHYKQTGRHLNRFAHDRLHNKQTDPNLPAVVVDTTIVRLHQSFSNFFRRLKTGEKPGFPRFKSYDRHKSFAFRDTLNKLKGNYFNSGKACAGKIRVNVHREMEGVFKFARIVKQPSGWYLQCVCETETKPLKKTGNQVGVDVGIKYLIADSNGNFVQNDKPLRNKLNKLRTLQRVVLRRKKGGVNRRKAVKNVARQHERITNRRKDTLHKVAREYVNKNDVIVMEDLRVNNMVRNHHLALSIMDASWGMLRNMLMYKAEEAGRKLIVVPPHFTSQKCYGCGEIVQKSLSVRTHLCPNCGFTADRDHNAALNILRAGTQPLGDNVCH